MRAAVYIFVQVVLASVFHEPPTCASDKSLYVVGLTIVYVSRIVIVFPVDASKNGPVQSVFLPVSCVDSVL